ncbi:MAG: rhomboid family intramembrane serine protease [Bacteroidota bacterium]
MLRLTPVVTNLLILNVLFYIIIILDKQFGFTPYGPGGLEDMLALHFFESPKFRPVQLATHFFMHDSNGLMHIFFNMFALVMFGPPLEKIFGAKRFLTYYFVCAIGAAALHMGYTWYDMSQMKEALAAFNANPSLEAFNAYFSGINLSNYGVGEIATEIRNSFEGGNLAFAQETGRELMEEWYGFNRDVPMVGASGAIYGLLLAFGMYFPDYKLIFIFLPVPIKARYFIPVLMLVELFLGFQRYSWDNIAHFAHLGGALIGLFLILYWRKFDPPNTKRWN